MSTLFTEALDRCLEVSGSREQELADYTPRFWEKYGKPEPDTPSSHSRLELMPFAWLMEPVTEMSSDNERTERSYACNLDEIWRAHNADLTESARVIGWRFSRPRLLRVIEDVGKDGTIGCRIPGESLRQKMIRIIPSNWQPQIRAKGSWLAGWIVPWQGAFHLAPGYDMLNAAAGESVLRLRGPATGNSFDRVALSAYRLAAALPRYSSVDFSTILMRIDPQDSPLQEKEQRAQKN